ncbi:MAG TPA: hypothetical protein VFP84_23745 [Kofleriaceae bacterium]|nr:hypothetical protein [Kofleriaceae bacterium]
MAAAGCDGGGFPPDAGVTPPAAMGTFSLAWSVTDTAGAPITCDQIGASTVAISLSSLDRVFGIAESFSCGNSPSTSPAIPIGNYSVAIELHGFGLDPVTVPPQSRVVITEGQTTALQPVTFAVNATGNLALQLAPPAPLTSNCGAGPGGAAIDGTSITLQDAAGACLPVTFTRTKNGAPNGTYTASCPGPAVATCIERDETLTATSVPSGPYTIHVRGKIGAADCFRNDDSLAVPAQGKALTRTLNLASSTPSC